MGVRKNGQGGTPAFPRGANEHSVDRAISRWTVLRRVQGGASRPAPSAREQSLRRSSTATAYRQVTAKSAPSATNTPKDRLPTRTGMG